MVLVLFVFPVLFLLVSYFLLSEEPGNAGAPASALGRLRWAACVVVLAGMGYASASAVQKAFEREPRYLLRFAADLPAQESPEAFLAHAPDLGARYFTYSPVEATIYPALEALRDTAAVANRFTLLFRDPGSGTLVYEIRP